MRPRREWRTVTSNATRHAFSRRALVASGLLAIFSLGVATTLSEDVLSRVHDQIYLPSVTLGGSSRSGANDCVHLGDHMGDDFELPAGVSVGQWTTASSTVAQTLVTDVQLPRFNTPAGLPPTQEPQDEDEDGAMIVSAMVLTVNHLYKGDPAIVGYVVPKWGGTSSHCPDYAYTREPQKMSASLGDSGVVFLYDPPSRWLTAPPVWYVQLKSVADGLGSNYKVMLPHNWYRYSGSNATSTWMMETKTITELVAEIEAALNP